MTKDVTLRLALEALTDARDKPMWNRVQMESAITAIKVALEAKDEPCCYGGIAHDCHAGKDCQIAERLKTSSEANDEPVAWWIPKHKAPDMVSKVRWSDECEPLYTATPQRTWVGLTDEEIDKTHETQVWDARRSYARAIEAKLKEKNT